MFSKNRRIVWYLYLLAIVALEAYTLILSDKGLKWAFVSLLFVIVASYIIHGLILGLPIHMRGYTAEVHQSGERAFCLFTALLFLFMNINFMLVGHVQNS